MVRINLLPIEMRPSSRGLRPEEAAIWTRAYQKRYRQQNREMVAKKDHDRKAAWWASLSEEEKNVVRDKKAASLRSVRRNWSPERREQEAERNRKYREENHDRMLKLWSDWRENNPEKHREHVHRAYRRMKAKDPAGWNQKYRVYRRAKRPALFEFFGNKCAKCGESEPSTFHIDHISGGANRLKKSGELYDRTSENYSLMMNDPERARRELQLLCANCNWIKRWEAREDTRKRDNPNLFEAYDRDKKRDHARKMRSDLVSAMGGSCNACGFSDSRAFHVDHRNNDGAKERKQLGRLGPAALLRLLLSDRDTFTARYQLLCANCHERKARQPTAVIHLEI